VNPTDLVAAAEASQDPLDSEALAPPGWSIKGAPDVNFAFRCISEEETALASIDEQEAHAIAAIKAHADALRAKRQPRVAFFTAKIVEYVEAHKKELLTGKRRSAEFLGGVASWRRKPAKVVVTDKPALVEWLSQHGDPTLMRVKVEPDLKAIDAMILATGVLPPGLDLEPESETLTVTATALPQISASIQKEITK
jgi:phage host-nuclease inhibitor protein Gam